MNYYCGSRQKNLTSEELKLHSCLSRKKGRRKNKSCRFLVKL